MNRTTLVDTASDIILSAAGAIENVEVQRQLIQRLAPGLARRLSELDLDRYAEFLQICVHEACRAAVLRASRENKAEDDVDDRQGFLPGFKHLQTHYSVRGITKRIEILSDAEIDEKIAEHRAQGAGHQEHADELIRYKDERNR
jgi:hypothetical protein